MNELPTENEVNEKALYAQLNYDLTTGPAQRGRDIKGGDGWLRLAPVAVYVPEPAEPTGLGAVVRSGNGDKWVRNLDRLASEAPWSGRPWRNLNGEHKHWSALKRPITLLKDGWTE